jgi:hypothetical protein
MAKATTQGFQLPIIYRLFFLFIEPIASLCGAYLAYFQPVGYLKLTDPAFPMKSLQSNESGRAVSIVLAQLANLYVLFAVNEALVLRSSSDVRVWKVVLFGLLLADFGHLYSVKPLGLEIYWNVVEWNVMAWGNVGFVCAGALMRLMFLSGFGLSKGASPKSRKRS